MKFKTQKFLGALVVCGCLAALRTQASFEYDFVPDGSAPGVSGTILLNAASNPNGDGTDIVTLNITYNAVSYTKGNIIMPGFATLDWDTSNITAMSLTLMNGLNLLSLTAGDDGSATIQTPGNRVTAGSWVAATSVPDAANTSLLFVIALGSLGVWHWLRRSRSVTVS